MSEVLRTRVGGVKNVIYDFYTFTGVDSVQIIVHFSWQLLGIAFNVTCHPKFQRLMSMSTVEQRQKSKYQQALDSHILYFTFVYSVVSEFEIKNEIDTIVQNFVYSIRSEYIHNSMSFVQLSTLQTAPFFKTIQVHLG